jgi:hypothetical protein
VTRAVDWHSPSPDRSALEAVALDVLPLERLGRLLAVGCIALGVRLWLSSEIPSIDKRLLAGARAEARLDKLLVRAENRLELRGGDVVEEFALAELSVGDGEPLLAVTGLPGRCQPETAERKQGDSLDSLSREVLVVH